MKATATAHPIQGLVKSHGLRDEVRNVPYHDSISLCTAPSRTTTTVEFGHEVDTCLVGGDPIDDAGYDRVVSVLDRVRDRTGLESGARVASENTFPSNVGLGASASAYAALAVAAADAASLDLSMRERSVLARHGAPSAARSAVGGFAHLRTSLVDDECAAEPIPTAFEEEIRVVVGHVPAYKRTARAHAETPKSHLFRGRLATVHGTLAETRRAIRAGDFERTFRLAERDSLGLLAVTMTGPDGWVYWRPETLSMLRTARRLRRTADIPVFFSADTGATAYLNTTADHVDRVVAELADLDVETEVWHVGGEPQRLADHLF